MKLKFWNIFLGVFALVAMMESLGAQTLTPTPDCCQGVTTLSNQGGYNNPVGECIDYAHDRLYVADEGNNSVHVYTTAGNPLTVFGAWTGGSFSQPGDVAVDPQGNIYVSDLGNNTVRKFDLNLNFLTSIGLGAVPYPRGVYVDHVGTTDSVYIVNQTNVYRYDGSGTTYSAVITFGNGLNTASDLVKVGNWLYVADTYNSQIVKFDTTLASPVPVTVIGLLSNPTAVRTDLAGFFYVVEFGPGMLDIYSSDFSTLIHQCQPPGNSWGVAVNQAGQVFLSEETGNAVTVLQGCVVEPSPTPFYQGANPPASGDCFIYPSPAKGDHATVSYNMAESGRMDLKIWNEKAELVAHVTDHKPTGVQITPFSISGFSTGVYFYALTLNYDSGLVDKIKPKKVVIIH